MSFRRAATMLCAACVLSLPLLSQADALDKARQFMAEGNSRAAVIELKNRLQQDPADGAARLLLGDVHLAMQAGEEAEKEYRRAAELGMDPASWRLKLLDALLLQRRFSEMLDLIDESGLEEDAQLRAELLARRGRALSGLERSAEAEEAFGEALALDPANEQAMAGRIMLSLQGADAQAVAVDIDRFLETYPNNAEMLLYRAELHRRAGELEEAKERFVQAQAQAPEDVRPVIGHATVAVAMNELEEASALLGRAEEIRKGLPMTQYLQGLVAFQRKDFEAAKSHLERVLRGIPGHLPSQLVLGVISFSNDELQLAEEYLSRVVAAMPGNLRAIKILGATRIKMREPERAIELLAPLAERSPDPQLVALLGSAYVLAGDEAAGQQWLSRAVEESPDAAALRTQLGLTLLVGGDTKGAIDELQSAVDLGQDVLQADVLLVLAHLKEKQFDQALAASRTLEQRHSDRALPYNLTGLAHLAQGQLDLAEERFNKALEVDPEFSTALMNLARVDVARGDPDAARARYEQVLERKPTDQAAMLGLAALAERGEDTAGMIRWLQRAQDANPSSLRPGLTLAQHHLKSGDALQALAVARDLSSRFPSNLQVMGVLASAQVLSGDKANAIRTLEQIIDLSPDNPVAHFQVGSAKAETGDYAGARRALEKAVALKPDFVQARYLMALAELKDGRSEEALAIARALREEYPDTPTGAALEGAIHLEQGQPAAAAEAFEAAYGLQKSSSLAVSLASAYLQDERPAEAIERLKEWTAENPEDGRALLVLAQALQKEERDEEAVAAYEALAGLGERSYLVLNNLAWLYQERGDTRALEVAREAYDLAPERPEVADTYGWILVQTGNSREGLSILQQAYVAFPTQTEIGYHVAVGLKEEGRDEEAVRLLRRLLREAPNFPQAEEARALLAELER
jgi:putative PEP-CTERM system TPR-repeat lipoprotein